MKDLFINARQFKGMEPQEAVAAIMADRAITKAYLVEDTTALGGVAPVVTAKKAVIAEAYIAALVAFVKAKRAEASRAVDESSVAQQTTNNEEESIMTNTNNEVVPVTAEMLSANLTAVAEAIITQLNTKVDAQSQGIALVLEEMNTRLDKSARHAKALEAKVAQLEAAQAGLVLPVAQAGLVLPVAPPVAEAPSVVAEAQQQVLPAGVDPNQVIFSDQQLASLENVKALSEKLYATMKDSYEKNNRAMGRTVGGFLSGTAAFVDDLGHKGVDSVTDFIDATIDTAKGLVVKTVEFASDTAHSVNGIGRNLGHLVINGTVYTLNSAGQLIERK